MMSARTWPGATEGSCSMSPTIKRAPLSGTAFMSACISMTSTMEASSRVFDDELPAEALRQPLTHHACDDVAPTAGGKADDDAHGPRRIGLRARNARQDRQRGSA